MKLRNLIKCHLAYLLSKTNMLIIGLIICLLVVVYVINGVDLDYGGVKENIGIYFDASLSVIRIVFYTLSCFMMGNFFSYKNDAYLSLLIISRIKRSEYFLTKILSIFYVLAIIIFILWVLWMFFGFVLIRGFAYNKIYLLSFLTIYLESLCYSLYACILVISSGSLFTFLVPTIASIFASSLVQTEINTFKKVIFLVFPVANSSSIYPYYGFSIIIFMIIFLIIASSFIYIRIDHPSS